MSTDRELLEAAAKAAGVHPHDIECTWNPITDDGDALRLAVKLGISIEPDRHYVCAISRNEKFVLIEKGIGGELLPAARRAIVCVAAKLGKAMP